MTLSGSHESLAVVRPFQLTGTMKPSAASRMSLILSTEYQMLLVNSANSFICAFIHTELSENGLIRHVNDGSCAREEAIELESEVGEDTRTTARTNPVVAIFGRGPCVRMRFCIVTLTACFLDAERVESTSLCI